MIARHILLPILPEIEDAAPLAALVKAERKAGISPEPIRRLAALLPASPECAASIGARLRLSKRQARRLEAAASRRLDDPHALAWAIGVDSAVDRFLLAGAGGVDLKALLEWKKPMLPVKGGELIAMGLQAGPLVAATMQAIEREWVRAGFPLDRDEVKKMARRHVQKTLGA
jgi:poly(A) polymerase